MTDSVLDKRTRQTEGYSAHTGRLKVSFKMPSGQLASVTLPDDWVALVARVAALESATPAVVPNSMEDLTYGG
jgi:hypothetical protein